jgi:hypothetical protein
VDAGQRDVERDHGAVSVNRAFVVTWMRVRGGVCRWPVRRAVVDVGQRDVCAARRCLLSNGVDPE